ncbi:MAG: carboxypeptidase-like regulatory domain-containing protein [Flavobacteriales bacterium]|nr:carboxypeptidase-like regulatory domain-containing protein [Flavobacteriales bacterium]
MKRVVVFLILVTIGLGLLAQSSYGSLRGTVVDGRTGEPLPFVNVTVEKDGAQVAGGSSDFEGKFNIRPIPSGTYSVKAKFAGYQLLQINSVVITSDKITFQELRLSENSVEMEDFEVIEYIETEPLIFRDTFSPDYKSKRSLLQGLPVGLDYMWYDGYHHIGFTTRILIYGF